MIVEDPKGCADRQNALCSCYEQLFRLLWRTRRFSVGAPTNVLEIQVRVSRRYWLTPEVVRGILQGRLGAELRFQISQFELPRTCGRVSKQRLL